VQTTNAEGLPTVQMEAMAMGKPVVSADCPGTAEVTGSPDCGYLYPRGDEDALLDRFRVAWEDTEVGEKAKQRVYKLYDWRVVAAELDKLYQDLLNP
jgi:glycosyltransferase involved in cell wall biosynthesis